MTKAARETARWVEVGAEAPAGSTRMVSCHNCDQLALMLRARATAHCPRCGAAMHRRKPNSIARTWALVLTAAILYVPANLLASGAWQRSRQPDLSGSVGTAGRSASGHLLPYAPPGRRVCCSG